MNNHLTIWNQMIKKKLCLTMVLKILFVSLTSRAQATGEKNSLYIILIIYSSIPCLKQRSKILN